MKEKRPRGPKNAMAGVENKWAKSGHLRNRSIPSGEAFKTPEKTCQSASKRTDFRPCSPVPHPPQRKALACASRALGPCARGSALGARDVPQSFQPRKRQTSHSKVQEPETQTSKKCSSFPISPPARLTAQKEAIPLNVRLIVRLAHLF